MYPGLLLCAAVVAAAVGLYAALVDGTVGVPGLRLGEETPDVRLATVPPAPPAADRDRSGRPAAGDDGAATVVAEGFAIPVIAPLDTPGATAPGGGGAAPDDSLTRRGETRPDPIGGTPGGGSGGTGRVPPGRPATPSSPPASPTIPEQPDPAPLPAPDDGDRSAAGDDEDPGRDWNPIDEDGVETGRGEWPPHSHGPDWEGDDEPGDGDVHDWGQEPEGPDDVEEQPDVPGDVDEQADVPADVDEQPDVPDDVEQPPTPPEPVNPEGEVEVEVADVPAPDPPAEPTAAPEPPAPAPEPPAPQPALPPAPTPPAPPAPPTPATPPPAAPQP